MVRRGSVGLFHEFHFVRAPRCLFWAVFCRTCFWCWGPPSSWAGCGRRSRRTTSTSSSPTRDCSRWQVRRGVSMCGVWCGLVCLRTVHGVVVCVCVYVCTYVCCMCALLETHTRVHSMCVVCVCIGCCGLVSFVRHLLRSTDVVEYVCCELWMLDIRSFTDVM